ncbi:MAG TPA: molecular chaperone HtpG [Bacillota bacterium]|jgi:molecular chaperone HtpG|nr:molecular chaperone HtpG [Bacillota bacterium]
MAKRQFKAESKRLLELMINSIYTNKEIFLRELLSNASDAIDKIYYVALTDENIRFNQEDYYIKITVDKDNRILKIADTGIGMTKDELSDNLGIIAKSGSLDFKKDNQAKDGYDIIGQFGVGFYSAFMVSDKVTVVSKALGSEEAYRWESEGAEGYSIEPCEKEGVGTEISLQIKQDTEDDHYEDFLNIHRLRSLVKKYSDFIRYPIKMDIPSRKLKEGSEDDFEEIIVEETVNSMVPIWRKNKSELKPEDYENFYAEKHYGFDKPLKYIHVAADGAVNYRSILFIPEKTPYDFYTKEYEKGLALYANGILIMEKCPDLLPDYFSFVKGMVDSEDLSLNISREMLQHSRQLKLIAKNIKNKVKSELLSLLKDDRDKYERFYASFGRQLKFGIYSEYGLNRDELQELLMFYSSSERKMTTLDEYVSRMKEDQKYIYYASGESNEKIDRLPQIELVADKGYEILYFTEEVDEFAIRVLMNFKEKEFKSVSDSDLGLEADEGKKEEESKAEQAKDMLMAMKEILGEKVADVRLSKRLKSHPVCLSSEGAVSIEMEKVLRSMPVENDITANKVMEINAGHTIYGALDDAFKNDRDKLSLYTNLLYNQALLIEGLSVEDPLEFSNDICKLMN